MLPTLHKEIKASTTCRIRIPEFLSGTKTSKGTAVIQGIDNPYACEHGMNR